jgi:GMP synthase-like glutamine amidotransferase
MHIGILKADTLAPQLSAQHGEYSDMIISLLDAVGAEFRYTVTDVENEPLPKELSTYDGFIITGSKMSVYDDVDWIKSLKSFVIEARRQNKKLLGICFGHQLLASALGGVVEKSPLGWGLGVATFEIYAHRAWQEPAQNSISLLMSHQDQVMRLPDGAQRIAGNGFCPHACFQLGENVLGIQGHPEFSPAYLQALLNTRRDRIGEAVVKKAEQTLLSPNDGLVVGGWISNFLSAI